MFHVKHKDCFKISVVFNKSGGMFHVKHSTTNTFVLRLWFTLDNFVYHMHRELVSLRG